MQIATGYTNTHGVRFVLVVNEAIWMPELNNLLMNPNQLREYGVEVQDNPYHKDPMVIKKEHGDDGAFIACLRSEGTNILLIHGHQQEETYKNVAYCINIVRRMESNFGQIYRHFGRGHGGS